MSLAVCVNRLTSGLVALAFPLLETGFTAGGTFFLFTIASLCTVWFYKVRGAWYIIFREKASDKILRELGFRLL